ncbi:MAG: class I SAM-dependent methyltransferase [Hyphomicrobiales bacterium]|nr:class I SAM-dependent methyltransferase [Hyphomicrobiales bacterium]
MTEAAREQTWTADGYERNARFVSDLGGEILGWLAPRPGERILDLGCGDGALTARLAAAGAQVVGVDASDDLLRAARARGLDARLMDGQALAFSTEFDAVFSNAALHWMTRPLDVIAGVRRALKPGGRFVAEFGGHGNVSAIVTAMRSAAKAYGGDATLAGPWFYPTAEDYRAMLEQAGFEVRRIGLFYRPTPLPTAIEGWLLTFRRAFFDQFEPGVRRAAIDHVAELLAPVLQDPSGRWLADYVRLRVEASLPAA